MYTCWVRSYFSLFFLVFPRIIRRFSIPDNSWPSWTKSQPWKPQQLDFARRGFRFGLPGVPGVGPRCRMLSPCVAISWSKFFDVLDPSRSGVRVRSSGKRVGKQFLLRLPNLQDFGFIKSGYKTCSNSLGTPDTFGLVTLISRFSMEMGIDGSQGQGSIMFHRNRIWRLKPFSVWPLAKLSIWRTGERSPNQKDEGESGFTVYDVTLLCNLKGTFGKNATTCNQCNKGSQDNSNLSLQGYRKICVHVGPRWDPLDPVGGPVRWLIALIAVAWQLWFAEATAASTPQMPWAKHWICAAMASAAIVETNWCNTRRWKQPVWDLHAQWAEPHGNRLVRTSC